MNNKVRQRPGGGCRQWICGVSILLAALGCSAEPDEVQPGSCQLSCSQPRVAAGEFEIVPLVPEGEEAISVVCEAPFVTNNAAILPVEGPVQVKYQVYELLPSFGKRPIDPREDPVESGGGAGGAEGEAAPPQALMERVPRSGISFEPMTWGGLAVDKTNPEHQNGDGTVSSYKYRGVVTPRSEWCSDSCGVMTYEFWPVCVAGKENAISASISAGAAFVRRSYRFTFTNTID